MSLGSKVGIGKERRADFSEKNQPSTAIKSPVMYVEVSN